MSSLGAMASSKRKREIEGVGNKSMIDLKAVLYQTEAGNGKRAKDVEVKRVRHMINVDIYARTRFQHAHIIHDRLGHAITLAYLLKLWACLSVRACARDSPSTV